MIRFYLLLRIKEGLSCQLGLKRAIRNRLPCRQEFGLLKLGLGIGSHQESLFSKLVITVYHLQQTILAIERYQPVQIHHPCNQKVDFYKLDQNSLIGERPYTNQSDPLFLRNTLVGLLQIYQEVFH